MPNQYPYSYGLMENTNKIYLISKRMNFITRSRREIEFIKLMRALPEIFFLWRSVLSVMLWFVILHQVTIIPNSSFPYFLKYLCTFYSMK